MPGVDNNISVDQSGAKAPAFVSRPFPLPEGNGNPFPIKDNPEYTKKCSSFFPSCSFVKILCVPLWLKNFRHPASGIKKTPPENGRGFEFYGFGLLACNRDLLGNDAFGCFNLDEVNTVFIGSGIQFH